MAASILKGMSFPKKVVSVDIDGMKVVAAENCKITKLDLGKDGNSLSFEQLDSALPFFPPEAAGILETAPLLKT